MTVGIALFGAGRVAVHHLDALTHVDGAELVAVVDPDEAAARDLATRYGADLVAATPEEALRSAAVDAVIVSAPTPLHHPLAASTIAAGKHVLVEKPLATSLAEARELVDAAAAAGVVVASGQVMRFMPMFTWAREFVASGRLGRPVQVIERRLAYRREVVPWWRDLPSFLVGHFGSHSVDLACHLLDARPVRVYCDGASVLPGHDGIDDCTLHVRLSDGTRLSSHLSLVSRYQTHDIVIVGTEATLTFDCYRSAALDGSVTVDLPEDEMLATAFHAQLTDFVEATRTGHTRAAAETTLPTQAAIDAADHSLRTGHSVDVTQ